MAIFTNKITVETRNKAERQRFKEVFENKTDLPQSVINELRRVTEPRNTEVVRNNRRKY